MSDCVFCSIAGGAIPAQIVARGHGVLAFRDSNPQAPVHVLVIPEAHVQSAATLTPEQHPLWSAMLSLAQEVARESGVVESGYRLVTNVGDEGRQSVHHLHLHLLGGRALGGALG